MTYRNALFLKSDSVFVQLSRDVIFMIDLYKLIRDAKCNEASVQ